MLLESALRNCDGYEVTEDGRRRILAGWSRDAAGERSRFPSSRPAWCCRISPACRCVVDLAAMRGAMKRLGGDPEEDQSAVPVDLVIDHSVQVDHFGTADVARAQRRPGIRAQSRALRIPALGPEGIRQFPRRAAGHRHRAPGESRISGQGRVPATDATASRRSRHAGRHRQPHDDDQRPGRRRLGRRRHRGRGRDARPAALHAHAGGGRLRADRPAAAKARRPPIWC